MSVESSCTIRASCLLSAHAPATINRSTSERRSSSTRWPGSHATCRRKKNSIRAKTRILQGMDPEHGQLAAAGHAVERGHRVGRLAAALHQLRGDQARPPRTMSSASRSGTSRTRIARSASSFPTRRLNSYDCAGGAGHRQPAEACTRPTSTWTRAKRSIPSPASIEQRIRRSTLPSGTPSRAPAEGTRGNRVQASLDAAFRRRTPARRQERGGAADRFAPDARHEDQVAPAGSGRDAEA